MKLKIATLGLLPILAMQAKYVKKNTPRLSEPSGARQGQCGQGTSLSILIVGDSAAAGVGVEQQSQALLGQLLQRLQHDYQVNYHLEAKSGRTTAQLIQAIQKLPIQHFDVVVTSIGVNDVTCLISPQAWLAQQQRLYCIIQHKFNPKLIVVASVPPMQLFPALPQPMAWLLGQYAKEMNQSLQRYMASQPNMLGLAYDLAEYQAMNLQMASDGFHPSAEIYAFWADKMAKKIKRRLMKHPSQQLFED
ncbi:SGNH/GDSL hydrolase family protein [uncultured Acinetobacter sp.]|uniref:SGNH/GDSL hydrolase family protein n=1 Tax=uncultured Acinetobacter sp. TaxID=165433 RepID=UPI00261EF47C|nr:SGNH/GDSL hydrolase family protein [uncultured Acinetobacter sp.]